MLEIFALVVLSVIVAVTIWLVVIIGNLPGRLARDAGHPQADAIALLGWVGLFTAGIGWFVALVWARVHPQGGEAALAVRLTELEQKVKTMETKA